MDSTHDSAVSEFVQQANRGGGARGLAVPGCAGALVAVAPRRPGRGAASAVLVAVALCAGSAAARGDDTGADPAAAAPAAGTEVAPDRLGRQLTGDAPASYLRAGVEMVAMLGAGTAWYWIDRERQVADWDAGAWEQRLSLDVWRLDSNSFPINFLGHAFDGTSFHLWARANELSLVESLGYGFATSLAWEYLLEFREKVSINDVLLTPVAGLTAGEFLHWLGLYVHSYAGEPRWWHEVARWSVGMPRAVHRTLDGTTRRPLSPPDRLGLSAHIWHRFEFALAAGWGEQDRDDDVDDSVPAVATLAARGELVALPGYLRVGSVSRGFSDGNVTSMALRLTRAGGDTSVDLSSDTIVLGHWRQRIVPGASGGVGSSAVFGLAVGYRYRKEQLGTWRDRLGLVHLPGPAVIAHWTTGPWKLRTWGRLHPDFAGIHAEPYGAWKLANDQPEIVEKSILRKHGYYYAWGASARAGLEVSGPWASVGAEGLYGRYGSQEGFDRAQERVTADLEASDRVVEWGIWGRLYVDPTGWYLEARRRSQRRHSVVEGFRSERSLTSTSLSVGVVR